MTGPALRRPLPKDHACRSRETASHIVLLPGLRREARRSKFYGDGVHLFFISSGGGEKGTTSLRPETPQRCGRLISWLNIAGGGEEEGLCLLLPFWLVYPFYFTIHRSWPQLVLQRQLGVPRTIEIPFSTVTDRPLFLETRFLGLRERHSRP